MKRSIVLATLTAAAFLIATTPAFAQHGRPSSPGASAGGMGMGGSHGSASSHSGPGPGNAGTNASTNAGSKTADQLLNSHLTANLQKVLPTGTTPQQVCANFTHLGPCVAAIHVSHNLKIDLNSLVCDMTLKPIGNSTCPAGTATGSKGMSLGASIAALNTNVNSKSESKKAMKQAKRDINDSNS